MKKIKFTGTLKNRIRFKFLWFWVTRGWETIPFTWEQDFGTGALAYTPIKGVPLDIALTVDKDTATIALRFMGQEVQSYHHAWSGQQIHWEPIKGNIIDATITVE